MIAHEGGPVIRIHVRGLLREMNRLKTAIKASDVKSI